MSLNSIFKTTSIRLKKYLFSLIDIVEKNSTCDIKNRNKEKSKNEIVKILAKLKGWNLSKSKNTIKFENTSTIEELNFLTPNIKIVFTKLEQAFIQILFFDILILNIIF